MTTRVLILHAEGDERQAERLAAPLQNVGYEVIYRGGLLIGESVVGATDRTLWEEGPVVICGTRAAMGDSMVLKSLRAAKQRSDRIRVFPVRLEAGAALEEHTGDAKIADCVKDFNAGLADLLRAINNQYPVAPDETGSPLIALCAKQVENPLAARLRHIIDSAPARAAVWLPLVNSAIRLAKSAPWHVEDPATPWSDSEWAAHLFEQLGILCTGIGATEKLETAELVLLATVPFIIQRLLDEHVMGIKAASSSSGTLAGVDVAEFARFKEAHSSIVDRARLLNDGSPEGKELAEAIERWLQFRYAVEKRKQWRGKDVATIVSHLLTGASDIVHMLELELIADLARAGVSTPTDITVLPEARPYRLFGGNAMIRWRLIASLLLLAERMALRPGILPETILHHLGRRGEITLKDMSSDVSAARFTLEPGSPLLVLHATCRTPTVDFALTELANELDGFLRSDSAVMRQLFLQQELAFPEGCQQKIHPAQEHGATLYTKPHVSFTMDPSDIRELLMGTELWRDPSLAYRELYQNALDACRYRRCRSEFNSIPYTPLIRFHQGRTRNGRRYVECEDNGVGMTRDLVRTCFARAGHRFATTTEFQREAAEWRTRGIFMTPNSQFGIGVFSYFLVADEIELETCRLGIDGESIGQRLLVQIPTASSLFRVTVVPTDLARIDQIERCRERSDKENGHLTAGTRVRLYLRESDNSDRSCIETLRRLVWFTETDVLATSDDGERLEWKAGHLAPWIEEYTEKVDNESRHWWVLRDGLVPPAKKKTQSDPLAPKLLDEEAESAFQQYISRPIHPLPIGRLLVDGIATTHICPCTIINLTGDEKPTLSLDRTEVQEWTPKRAIDRCEAALSRRVSADTLPFHWLHAFWITWPRQAWQLWELAVAQRAKWSFLDEEIWEGIAGEKAFFPLDREFWNRRSIKRSPEQTLFALWRGHYWNGPHSRSVWKRLRQEQGIVQASIDARIEAEWRSGHAGFTGALLFEPLFQAETGLIDRRSITMSSRLGAFYKMARFGMRPDADLLRKTGEYIGIELPETLEAEIAFASSIDDQEALLLRLRDGELIEKGGSHRSASHLLNASKELALSLVECATRIIELARRAGLPEPQWSAERLASLGSLTSSEYQLAQFSDVTNSAELQISHLIAEARRRGGDLPSVARRFQALFEAFGTSSTPWKITEIEALAPISEKDMIQLEHVLRQQSLWGPFEDDEPTMDISSSRIDALATALGMAKQVPYVQDRINRKLLSHNLNGRPPRVPDRFTVRHIVAAVATLHLSVKDCALRIKLLSDQFGYALPSNFEEAIVMIESLDDLDWRLIIDKQEETLRWETEAEVSPVDVLWLAKEYGLSPEPCARRILKIAQFLDLKPQFATLDELSSLPTLTSDEWVLISRDLDGEPPFLDKRPTVARMIAASARTGRPLAWLHSRLKDLAPVLGFGPPADEATYVGVSWQELVAFHAAGAQL